MISTFCTVNRVNIHGRTITADCKRIIVFQNDSRSIGNVNSSADCANACLLSSSSSLSTINKAMDRKVSTASLVGSSQFESAMDEAYRKASQL
jgi:hypothetical protein